MDSFYICLAMCMCVQSVCGLPFAYVCTLFITQTLARTLGISLLASPNCDLIVPMMVRSVTICGPYGHGRYQQSTLINKATQEITFCRPVPNIAYGPFPMCQCDTPFHPNGHCQRVGEYFVVDPGIWACVDCFSVMRGIRFADCWCEQDCCLEPPEVNPADTATRSPQSCLPGLPYSCESMRQYWGPNNAVLTD